MYLSVFDILCVYSVRLSLFFTFTLILTDGQSFLGLCFLLLVNIVNDRLYPPFMLAISLYNNNNDE